ncbi:MAG: hypothetical protein AB1767_06080 [Bacillota bacterium]
MSYQAPTLKLKYMKPAYLELADQGFTSPGHTTKDLGMTIVGVTGGIRAAVDSGEKVGTIAGQIYVSKCGSGNY